MGKTLVVYDDRCVACKACTVACAMAHTDATTLAEAAMAEYPPQSRVYVEPVADSGVPVQCRHCEAAPCIDVCPADAISRAEPDATVLIDPEACTGCTFCTLACPFGAIEMTPGAKKPAFKCDLCRARAGEGLGPACVDACPTETLEFADIDDALAAERAEFDQSVADANAADTGEPAGEEKIAACEVCGGPVAPRKQLKFLRDKLDGKSPVPNVCPSCRRSRTAKMLATRPAKTSK